MAANAGALIELTQVKPGNPIYVRVVDPDRSTTHQRDTITVRASASSGDVVKQFPQEKSKGKPN